MSATDLQLDPLDKDGIMSAAVTRQLTHHPILAFSSLEKLQAFLCYGRMGEECQLMHFKIKSVHGGSIHALLLWQGTDCWFC